jgi:predicted Zn-dependent protease
MGPRSGRAFAEGVNYVSGAWIRLPGPVWRVGCGVLDYPAMRKFPSAMFAIVLACGPLAVLGSAQASRTAADTAVSRAEQGIELAQRGACERALPLLAGALPHIADKQLRYAAAMARARCGMSLHRMTDAVEALALLNREFPTNPQVLYFTTHSFSELSDLAARKLVMTDPDSAQAMELQAEVMESHGKVQDAIQMYHQILAKHPDTPGIHYRLGRLLLEGAKTDAAREAAQKEFEEELKIVPHSAATEFMLGDLAWDAQNLPEAIKHFSLATQDDVGFSESFLGLGVALNASGKYAQAILPLEKYVKAVPDDPAGHYQLAIAYARTGRKKDADQQMAIQRRLDQKEQQQKYRTKDPN